MDDHFQSFKKINFSSDRRNKKTFKRFLPILLVVAIVLGLIFLWSFFSTTSSIIQFAFGGVGGSHIKSTDGRVNILLLGLAGGKHDGTLLTDSIIVASYDLKSHNVTFISIPRDLWLDGIKNKVNAAYEFGLEPKNGGNGLKFAEDKIDDILGIPIHYGIRIDFSGFSKAIDLVNGVDVNVPKAFDDYNYPITGKEDDLCGLQEKEKELTDNEAKQFKLIPGTPDESPNPSPSGDLPKKKYEQSSTHRYKVLVDSNDKIATSSADFACRFEHIHFDAKLTHMDGETALKFVRSRMGTNGEGSDFARSRRQQLVIQSFRTKVLSLDTLFNPSKIAGLLGTFGESVDTDISSDTYLEFYNLAKAMNQVDNIVLGDLGGGKSVFVTGAVSEYGAYVVIPPKNDFTSVKEFVNKKLTEDATASATVKK